MNILIIGSGGREHALAWKCAQDQNVNQVFVAPGNGGTSLDHGIENLKIDIKNADSIANICNQNGIDLVIIGPEQPLVDGLVDDLQLKNINVFGPSAKASRLEGSKAFSKEFFKKYKIPTANYTTFNDIESALDHLKDISFPTVIKADGLAAGKGVLICQTITEGEKALEEIFVDNAFGSAGNKVVIEDFLEGEEASFIAVVSGEEIIPLATSQDHKAAYDGDKGPNTGGMGAYSPAPIVTDELHKKIMDEVMNPTVKGLIAEGSSYLGFLYAGLMIKDDEINVLEFNCRFGDPETQPIMMRLESSLVELCLAAINNNLSSHQVRWSSNHACGVVIASEGYPGNYETDKEVVINNHSEDDVKLFHAGTKIQDNQLVTSGGRVFCATGTGADLATAQKNAYNLVSKISFEGAVNRKDIGNKGIS